MRRALAIAGLWCAAIAGPLAGSGSIARAQPMLVGGLGGTTGFGRDGDSLIRGDATSAEVIFGTAFPAGISLFGTSYSSLWVNTDGSVSFTGPQSYRPDAFTGSPRPIIAAWWADVDTTPGPQAGDPPGANTVYFNLSTNQLVVTWFRVGYYMNGVDQRVSVQLILRQVAGMPDGIVTIELRYNLCEWTQGMRGDSVPAQAGFDLGDETRYLSLPRSREFDVVDGVCNGTNASFGGIWRFRSDALPPPVCGNGLGETGEECDDGDRPGPPCEDDCTDTAAMPFDAAWLPEGGRPDGGSARDAGGGRDSGGAGDDGGGIADMDGGGAGRDGGGRPDPDPDDTIDVFGGGCSHLGGRRAGGLVWSALVLAAIAARARSRR